MEEELIVIFRREIDPRCTLTSLYFTVFKTIFGFGQTRIFIFHAIVGDLENGTLQLLPRLTLKKRYQDQAGYIECLHGWIDNLQVFEQTLGGTENPRSCGLGVLLTELCLT